MLGRLCKATLLALSAGIILQASGCILIELAQTFIEKMNQNADTLQQLLGGAAS